MKLTKKSPNLAAAVVCGLGMLANVSARADADDKAAAPPAASPVQRNADGEMVIVLDAATQKRLKLETAHPAAATWQPHLKGYGRVLDPTPLAAAMVDLAAARLNVAASAKEYERVKTLSGQDNASPRALEAAQTAAQRDQLALTATQVKFAADWGRALADRDDLPELARRLGERKDSMARVILPAGEQLTNPPAECAVTIFPNETELVPAELIDLNFGIDPQTEGQIVWLLIRDRALPLNAAVTGRFTLAGQPVSGVTVPAAAVLRHEGLGWVYLRTADDKFTRHHIDLDKLAPGGFFIPEGLAVTNEVVATGAATVLSAELSGGDFNTGTRD